MLWCNHFITSISPDMTDTSAFAIEERLVAGVWVHTRPHTGETMSQIMDIFANRFHKGAPRKAIVLDWEKRAFELASVLDRQRFRCRVSRNESYPFISGSFVFRSPQKSVRKLS